MVYVTAKNASEELGIGVQTLRKWANAGKIDYIKTPTGHRKYDIQSYIRNQTIGPDIEPKENGYDIVYCRVSSSHQRDDLERQKDFMSSKYPDFTVITDVGSGINFKRPGLRKILEFAFEGNLRQVVVAHKDRLCRFGFELLEWIFEKHGAKIVVLDRTNMSPEKEFTEDLLSIVHVFSSRFNGFRRYRNKIEKTVEKENTDSDCEEKEETQ